jgi:hypothetical protein
VIKTTVAHSNRAGLAYARSLLVRDVPKINTALASARGEGPRDGSGNDTAGGPPRRAALGSAAATQGVAASISTSAPKASRGRHRRGGGSRASRHSAPSDWAHLCTLQSAEKENMAAYDEAENALTLVHATTAIGSMVCNPDMVRALGFDNISSLTVTYRGEQLTLPL